MKTLIRGVQALLSFTLLIMISTSACAEESEATFSQAELDQMMAPIALYPDSLLSQILMASTYPVDVAEAVTWSKNNPDLTGDAAVEAVQNKPWDPSVMSLAAFPQVLAMMGEQPDWVQDLGDAFLATPDAVMDTAQNLRSKAKEEGNLESTEQQTVITEEASTGQTVIVIEPADPQVVYVPTYNPTIIYGTWWWPAYRPYYYRPVGWGFTAGLVTGIGWGIGIGITNSLWGRCNWGRSSIDINISRYNNININKNRLDSRNRNTSWKHNSKNRRGVPYRDKNSRQKYDRKLAGADKRKDYRGRDVDREKARASLEKRGIDPSRERDKLKGSGGREVRDSVNRANRDVASGKLGGQGSGKGGELRQPRDTGKSRDAVRSRDIASGKLDGKGAGKGGDLRQPRDTGKTRDAVKSRDVSKRSGSRDNALRGAGNAQKSTRNINRGTSSNRSMRSHSGSRSGGGARSGGRRR